MSHPIRSEQEEYFEQLCVAVDAGETHEQEAIEYFEAQSHESDFDAAQWLDIALYHAPEVARGIIDFVDEEDRARSDIAQTIANASARRCASRSPTAWPSISTWCSTAATARSTISKNGPTKTRKRRSNGCAPC